ncbi:MAG: hypothetical protein M1833_004216 [Piccolia ochrophora]|nr:MAG: hypothetical protein M1833_004216 [Piccolia ochrophora]
MKTILVIGGSYAGLTVAHKLLKQTLPTVKGGFRVMLLSQSTHLYWNMAAPRAVIRGLIPDDHLFQPIAPAFAKYPQGSFEFVEGTAKQLDEEKHAVIVDSPTGAKTINYDIAVIATGSSAAPDTPFKYAESYQKTLDGLHEFQEKVHRATTIVVGGAGPTGVETAAELGDEYTSKGKKITLITNGDRSMPFLRKDVGNFADKELEKLGVAMKRNVTVESTKPAGTQTEIQLSDGSTLTADLYISTVGVKANSAFVDPRLLDSEGNVQVDEYLRVKGATDLWAAGDVVNIQRKQIKFTEDQAIHLSGNLDAILKDNEPKIYKQNNMLFVAAALGKNRGTGIAGYFKLLSVMVWYLKGRTYGTDKIQGLVNGKRLVVNSSM